MSPQSRVSFRDIVCRKLRDFPVLTARVAKYWTPWLNMGKLSGITLHNLRSQTDRDATPRFFGHHSAFARGSG
jgi:hypothetical protein